MSDTDTAHAEQIDAAYGPLAAQLLSADTYPHLVSDCKALVASEIKKKGMTLRTGLRMVEKIKPDIVDRTVRELMPGFVHELEPYYADYRARGEADFEAYLRSHEDEIAQAMLAVTDRRADQIQNRTILSAYSRVRGRAQREIVAAMPGIARVIARYAE